MAGDERRIRDAWRALGGGDGGADDLLARHREPHRRYHTVVHVARVLDHVDELLAEHPLDEHERAAVRLAALYHDAVYDPRAPAGANERASADLAAAAAQDLGWDALAVLRVHDLVLATAAHEPGGDDVGAAVLVDADLAILGADPAVYGAYVRGVRQEYAHVDDAAWRRGRPAVLRTFLDRPAVYATATMRARRERRARANLTAELADLGAVAGG